MIAYVDGIIRLEDARVPLDDRGAMLGDAVFETLRTLDHTPCFLDAHMARLGQGLETMGFPDARQEARRVVLELAEARGIQGHRRIRVTVSPGRMDGVAGAQGGTRVTGVAVPLAEPHAATREAGIRLRSSAVRKDPENPLSTIKHASYAPFMWARRDAVAAGANDALLWNTEGRVAEASTSNVFALVDGTVHAPGATEGALRGVTRDVILEILRGQGTPVVESLDRAQLARAEEAWITSTSAGVLSIASADDWTFDGRSFAAELHASYVERLRA